MFLLCFPVRWIVGDVQGCARELDDLLRAIRFDPQRDELHLLGDLVNRGRHSLETLRLWTSVGGGGVLGNHDVYALLVRSGRWKRQSDTLQALFDAPDAEPLLARLRELPVLLHLPSERNDAWIVHAGLDPRWTDLHRAAAHIHAGPHDDDWLLREDVDFATRVRCCTPEGERSRHDHATCPPPHRPWDEFYRGEAIVLHGHWARRGHYRSGRVIGLDSGCVYGGKLTAWCQDEDRIVQVPARSR